MPADDKIETIEQLKGYLQGRWKQLQRQRQEYEERRPNGSESVEDSLDEGCQTGAENEVATLLAKIGINPYL